MIKCSIDRNKINASLLKKTEKTAYLNFVLMTNKDGQPDKYGHDGFIVQDVSKEQRDAGERGPIIGNWKELRKIERPEPQQQSRGYAGPENDQEIPF